MDLVKIYKAILKQQKDYRTKHEAANYRSPHITTTSVKVYNNETINLVRMKKGTVVYKGMPLGTTEIQASDYDKPTFVSDDLKSVSHYENIDTNGIYVYTVIRDMYMFNFNDYNTIQFLMNDPSFVFKRNEIADILNITFFDRPDGLNIAFWNGNLETDNNKHNNNINGQFARLTKIMKKQQSNYLKDVTNELFIRIFHRNTLVNTHDVVFPAGNKKINYRPDTQRMSFYDIDDIFVNMLKRYVLQQSNMESPIRVYGYYAAKTNDFHQESCIAVDMFKMTRRTVTNPVDLGYVSQRIQTELAKKGKLYNWCNQLNGETYCTTNTVTTSFLTDWFHLWLYHIDSVADDYTEYRSRKTYRRLRHSDAILNSFINVYEELGFFNTLVKFNCKNRGNADKYTISYIKKFMRVLFNHVSNVDYKLEGTKNILSYNVDNPSNTIRSKEAVTNNHKCNNVEIKRYNHGSLHHMRCLRMGKTLYDESHIYINNLVGSAHPDIQLKMKLLIQLSPVFVSLLRIDESSPDGTQSLKMRGTEKGEMALLKHWYPNIYESVISPLTTTKKPFIPMSSAMFQLGSAAFFRSFVWNKIFFSQQDRNNKFISEFVEMMCFGIHYYNPQTDNQVMNTIRDPNTPASMNAFNFLYAYIQLPHYIDHCRQGFSEGPEKNWAPYYYMNMNPPSPGLGSKRVYFRKVVAIQTVCLLAQTYLIVDDVNTKNGLVALLEQEGGFQLACQQIGAKFNTFRNQNCDKIVKISNNFDMAWNNVYMVICK